MASRADSVPREHELLCEHCGYGVDGLSATALCPECGNPVADSTTSDGRVLPPWELEHLRARTRLWQTTSGVLLRPRQFFRRMLSRRSPTRSVSFAFVQHWLAGYFFSVAIALHLLFVHGGRWDLATSVFVGLLGGTALTPFVFATITFTGWLVAKLSALEARYHGMRLPPTTIRRALHYLSAHLLPVSLLTVLLVFTYRAALASDLLPRATSEQPYLYTLCAWVVLAAAYLFWAYWMAMRNLMYANR